ncbi:pentapeptide repeat-containing protein [Microlunatus sagamiharensis]|uniref:pentapeptide repeat-containing protein n=1 Tax=Microlunatus sagamiharensis TaxID=546874 RepID=UPI000B890927|nr:pentapeptide repeat-containing protein [Microlunatus sagamiharensis]
MRTWLTGQGPQPDGLGVVGGRVDLRGIPLTATPATIGDPDDPARGVAWESLDLSGAQLEELRFFGGSVRDCRFDGASLTGLKLWGTEVVDCSFKRADLRSRALGTGEWHGRRTVWRRVAFDRANLREATFRGCLLEACTFEKTTKRLLIEDCEVVDCVFTGVLDTLLVSGRALQHPVSPSMFSADFSRAVFEESKIEGYSLDRVVLPEQDDLLVVRHYPAAARRALAWLADQPQTPADQQALHLVRYWATAPAPEDGDLCLDLGERDDPEGAAALRRAFAHAEDEPAAG